MKIQIKICGMKFPENITEIAALQPDYLGFIFYAKSPRYITEKLPEINAAIKKVGVFVNAEFSEIMQKAKDYQLDFIQLHGEETPDFCKKIDQESLKVIKAFNISKEFNFSILNKYTDSCNHFLFDTKGAAYGGNGNVFDWQLLENYNLEKTYFLSGGIGLENAKDLKAFLKEEYPKNCIAIDLNSRFEIKPGLKNKAALKEFIQQIKQH
jgi:phosphoribosylanthranilate isomerase